MHNVCIPKGRVTLLIPTLITEEVYTPQTPTTVPILTWCKDSGRESPALINLHRSLVSETINLKHLVLTLAAQDMWKYKYVRKG
jgi:hypothetical protein